MLVGPQRELNLQKQFDKILDIDSIGLLNSDFMLGYIAAYMEQLKQKT